MTLRAVAAAPHANKQLQLWAVSETKMFTCWKLTTQPNSNWTDWVEFNKPPGNVQTVTTGMLSDGRPQLWALTDQGLFSCWPLTGEPGSDWGNWGGFPKPHGN
ncbi:hypothetical protein [Streptomyces bohaiensis]|uniref:hypothetical protein n=1 Tax=Streptomyces bohaiensis TaxID=1431344 RepID=UPI003B7EEE2B